MKRIALIISIIAVSFSSCSLLTDEESKDIAAIQKAETEAVQRIKNASVTEVENAKREINLAVTDVISKADTTLTQKFQVVERAMTQKAEETKKDLGNRIQGIEDRITKSCIIGLVGAFLGLVGLIVAILAYRKKPRTNIRRVKELIHEEIFDNPNFPNTIRSIINGASNSRLQTGSGYSSITQQQIIREVEAYIHSRKFKEQLESILQTQTGKPILPNISTESTIKTSRMGAQPSTSPLYELYAKESDSMQLSSIQNSYQKGKSIYKLILAEPNSNTAQVSLCIEQEDAKERILAYDNQYLEPICIVSRLSSQPATVEVKSMGMAERIGEEWKVSKQVIVEIK